MSHDRTVGRLIRTFFSMSLWKVLWKWSGWKLNITVPARDKCVICVAPHTSNFDFLIGLCAYRSLGRKANFLMKKFWFFFPLKYLLKYLGGIPVDRNKKTGESLTQTIIIKFHDSDYINLAVTPEGTRSRREKWHTGFLYIAYGAGVPIQLGLIDYAHKCVDISREYTPTGDIETDMAAIKAYYRDSGPLAKHPDKFAY